MRMAAAIVLARNGARHHVARHPQMFLKDLTLGSLLVQFFVYDQRLWRGQVGRTWIHVAVSLLWCYLTGVYAFAAALHAAAGAK